MMQNWYIVFGILLVFRGLWGIYRYLQGRGAKFYHFPGYEELQKARNIPWYQRYVNWSALLLWTGSKNNASEVERWYLLIGSALQVVAGIVLLVYLA